MFGTYTYSEPVFAFIKKPLKPFFQNFKMLLRFPQQHLDMITIRIVKYRRKHILRVTFIIYRHLSDISA